MVWAARHVSGMLVTEDTYSTYKALGCKLVTSSSDQLNQQCLFQHWRKTGLARPGEMVIIFQDGTFLNVLRRVVSFYIRVSQPEHC